MDKNVQGGASDAPPLVHVGLKGFSGKVTGEKVNGVFSKVNGIKS